MTVTTEQPLVRILLVLIFIAGLFMASLMVFTPLEPGIQGLFGFATVIGILIVGRVQSRLIITILTVLAFLFACRYMWWRVTETLDLQTPLALFFGIGLFAAEVYLWIVLLVTFVQSAWPLGRKPQPLPDDVELWPTVDVFIPTFNESLELISKTVYAAKDLEYPPEKLQIYILDDGSRQEIQDFARRVGVGYITRDDNAHAKAGNLNNALSRTNGSVVAILDCDHVPTRWFLQLTAGWFLRNPNIAVVQTPHHFYNLDPFLRNLSAGSKVPSESLLFYGLVQDGNDFWNACFFCGSCALLRRTALEGVGGFATDTVTEDAHTALRLHRAGWRSAFIRFPMAAGLATETLGRFVQQRTRWAQGMIQILRTDSPLFGPGLTVAQRLCYLSAMMHFLFPLPKFVLLTAPLAFLLLDIRIISASAFEVFTYAVPYLMTVIYVNWRIQGKFRHSFWSDVYETATAIHLLWPTIKTMIKPEGAQFRVTSKGGDLDEEYFDYKLMFLHTVVTLLIIFSIGRGFYSLTDLVPVYMNGGGVGDQIASTFLNLFWATVSLSYFMAALATARETSHPVTGDMVRAEMPGVVWLADGRTMAGTTSELSFQQLNMIVPRPSGDIATQIHVDVEAAGDRIVLPAVVQSWEEDRLIAQFAPATEEDEAALVRLIFGRGDAWIDWDKVSHVTPLRAAGEIVGSGLHFLGWCGKRLKARTVDPAFGRPARSDLDGGQDRTPKSVLEDAMRAAAQSNRQMNTLLILGAAMVLGLFAAGIAPAQAQVQAPGQQATPVQSQDEEQPGSDANSSGSVLQRGLGLSRPTGQDAPARPYEPFRSDTPSTLAPLFTDSDRPASFSDTLGTTAVQASQRRDNRLISLTLRDLGAEPNMRLRNGSIRGIPFQIRSDEVITEALLSLNLTFSQSLLSGRSYIVVMLNGEGIETIELDPNLGTTRTVNLDIDPFLIQTNNELLFEFIGEGQEQDSSCPGTVDDDTWVKIGQLSKFVLSASRFRVRNDLALMPSPFFDRSDPTRLELPFILGDEPSLVVLKAAGIVASYWGQLADFRGAAFPVVGEGLPPSSAVVFARPGRGPAGIALPKIDGPTLAIIDNPASSSSKLLLVLGRNDTEILAAAQALSIGQVGLSGPVISVAEPELGELSKPYDAPRWLPNDRPIALGEFTTQSQLEGRGLTPGVLNFNFRTSPDIFTWSNDGVPATIRYRFSEGPWIDTEASRLDVLVNNQFIKSLPLRKTSVEAALDSVGSDDFTMYEETVSIPPTKIGGQNQLQFFFDLQPIRNEDECAEVIPTDLRTAVDVQSEIDMRRIYRMARMPNLAYLAQAGFPFTRLADLSQTAIVLPEPERIENSDIEALLTLMGLFGARTGYPGLRVEIVTPDQIEQVRRKDILLLGSWDRQPLLQDWASEFNFEVQGNMVIVPGVQEVGPGDPSISSWYWQRPDRSQVRIRNASVKAGLVSFRSPNDRERTVVGLISSEGNSVRPILNALTSPDLSPEIQGDLVTVEGDTIQAYKVAEPYTIGNLPFHIWVRWFLSNKPIAMIGVTTLAGLLLGFPIFTWLRSNAARISDY